MSKIIDFFRATHSEAEGSRKARYMALLRPHVRLMYSKALQWSGTPENAEDLVQDVLIKLVDRVDELERIDKPAPWLLKILYRQFVDGYRKQARQADVPESTLAGNHDAGDDPPGFLESVPDATDFTDTLAERQALARALKCLDKDMRRTFLLLEYKGYSIEETARLLNEKPGTIKSRNHRAKEKLKKIMSSGTFSTSPSC